ncbi:MAG: LysE family transporter [Paracoccus sp. (in: a-proteobacteria)]
MTLDVKIFATIIAVYVMVVISPGPNFVLVTRYSLRGFTGFAFALTVGFAIGATINATLTMFGLGSIMAANPLFRSGRSGLAAAFLIYLGVGALLPALKARSAAIMSGQRARRLSWRMPRQTRPIPGDRAACSWLCRACSSTCSTQRDRIISWAYMRRWSPVRVLRPSWPCWRQGCHRDRLVKGRDPGAGRPRFRSLYTSGFSIDAIMGGLLVLVGLSILYEASAYLEAP